MKSKKLFVFLHGFGFTKNENKESIKSVIESKDDMYYLSLDAPFESGRERGGFARYDITPEKREHIFDNKFTYSLEYIKDNINRALKKYKLNRSDVILCGRSQGAFMAMYLGLTVQEQCYKVISLCGGFKNIHIEKISNPEIIRLEATHDTLLSHDKKESKKILENLGCKVTYIEDKLSDHDNINKESFTALLSDL